MAYATVKLFFRSNNFEIVRRYDSPIEARDGLAACKDGGGGFHVVARVDGEFTREDFDNGIWRLPSNS